MRTSLLAMASIITIGSTLLANGSEAQAVLIGNVLSPRQNGSDGVSDLLYTNFVPMPGKGTVDSVSIFFQGSANTFRMFQLRPSGPPNNYLVVYDSGTISPAGIVNTPISLPFPNGTTDVLGGDIFAHYGFGIPYSDFGGLNAVNTIAIYYSSPLAPIVSNVIVLGSGSFPQNNSYIRDYAWAVDFTAAVPEPSTFALLGLGVMGAAVRARRKSRAAKS